MLGGEQTAPSIDTLSSAVFAVKEEHLTVEALVMLDKDESQGFGTPGARDKRNIRVAWHYEALLRHQLHQWSTSHHAAIHTTMDRASPLTPHATFAPYAFTALLPILDVTHAGYELAAAADFARAQQSVRAKEEQERVQSVERHASARAECASSTVLQAARARMAADVAEHKDRHWSKVRGWLASFVPGKEEGFAHNAENRSQWGISDSVLKGQDRFSLARFAFIMRCYGRSLEYTWTRSEEWAQSPTHQAPSGAEALMLYLRSLDIKQMNRLYNTASGAFRKQQAAEWSSQLPSAKEEAAPKLLENAQFEVADCTDDNLDLDYDPMSEFGFDATPQPQRWLRARNHQTMDEVAEIHPVLQAALEDRRRNEQLKAERAAREAAAAAAKHAAELSLFEEANRPREPQFRRASYDYKARRPEELSLKKGEQLTFVEDVDAKWVLVRRDAANGDQGVEGVVPIAYVKDPNAEPTSPVTSAHSETAGGSTELLERRASRTSIALFQTGTAEEADGFGDPPTEAATKPLPAMPAEGPGVERPRPGSNEDFAGFGEEMDEQPPNVAVFVGDLPKAEEPPTAAAPAKSEPRAEPAEATQAPTVATPPEAAQPKAAESATTQEPVAPPAEPGSATAVTVKPPPPTAAAVVVPLEADQQQPKAAEPAKTHEPVAPPAAAELPKEEKKKKKKTAKPGKQIGDRVTVEGFDGQGTIRYKGKFQHGKNEGKNAIGVELDDKVGAAITFHGIDSMRGRHCCTLRWHLPLR